MTTTETKVLTPREQVLQDYNVNNGRIVSPGKFEGEPIFAPYYWDQALEGMADEDDGEAYTFETEQGFVICF